MGKERLKIITCEGDLSIENTKTWLDKFNKTVKSSDDIRISLKRIEKLDLSFIQLIIALRKTCAEKNIKFNLTGDLPESVKETLLVLGIFKKDVNSSDESEG